MQQPSNSKSILMHSLIFLRILPEGFLANQRPMTAQPPHGAFSGRFLLAARHRKTKLPTSRKQAD